MNTQNTEKDIYLDEKQIIALLDNYKNHPDFKNLDKSAVKHLAIFKENDINNKYYMNIPFNATKREEGTERKINYNGISIQCKRSRFTTKTELLHKTSLTTVNLDIIQNKLNSSAARAKDFYNSILADLISENGLCYDGKPFFYDQHPVNPINAELGTYTNLINDISLDDEGLTYALDTLRAIKNWDGQPMNLTSDEIIVIVSNKKQEAVAKKLDDKVKVVYLPWLEYKAPGTWYVMRNNEAEKPFLVSSNGVHPCYVFPTSEDSDYFRINTGATAGFDWEAEVITAYLLPQVIVKCVEPSGTKLINCANCAKEINKTRPWSKYCSDACKVAFHRKNK